VSPRGKEGVKKENPSPGGGERGRKKGEDPTNADKSVGKWADRKKEKEWRGGKPDQSGGADMTRAWRGNEYLTG